MPSPVGHRAAVKKNIVDSARRLFNRYGFESVSIQQIMAGAGLQLVGFTAILIARATFIPRYSDASSPTPNGKTAGKAYMWIYRPLRSALKSCAHIYRASILKMSTTRVRWWPYRPTLLAPTPTQSALLRPYFGQWSVFWSGACAIRRSLVASKQRPLLLYALVAWWLPVPWSIARLPMNCARRARSWHIISAAGRTRVNREQGNPLRSGADCCNQARLIGGTNPTDD